jgi:hypothetical protein
MKHSYSPERAHFRTGIGSASNVLHPAATLLGFLLPLWKTTKWVAWLRWPAWLMAGAVGVLTALLTTSAQAGWLAGPDRRTEAANRTLEQAARIANEAARTQANDHGRYLEAVAALAGEREQLAGYLQALASAVSRDSVWAAALNALGPALVAVTVLAVGGLALWLVLRPNREDALLASLLVDELEGGGTGALAKSTSRAGLQGGPERRHMTERDQHEEDRDDYESLEYGGYRDRTNQFQEAPF